MTESGVPKRSASSAASQPSICSRPSAIERQSSIRWRGRPPRRLYAISYRALSLLLHGAGQMGSSRASDERGTGHERHQDPRRQVATARRDRRRRARGARRRRCGDCCDQGLAASRQAQTSAIATDAAGELGVTPAALTAAIKKAMADQIDAQVTAGTLTEGAGRGDQGASRQGRRAALRPRGGGKGGPGGARPRRARRRPDLPRRRGDLHRRDDRQLRTQLEAGKSLATIATDNGKTVEGLKAALTTAAKTDLDAAVTAGRLTQAQADKLLAALPARLDDEINETHTGGPGGHGGPRRPAARDSVEHRSDGLTWPNSSRQNSTTLPSPPSPGRPPSLRGSVVPGTAAEAAASRLPRKERSMLIEHQGARPRVHPSAYVAPNAVSAATSRSGPDCRILFGAVLTAEDGPIRLGERCIVMENAVVRGRAAHPVRLGDRVLIGPHAHVNGAEIGDEAFVATGASLFPGSRLGAGAEIRINGVLHVNSSLPPAPSCRSAGSPWAIRRRCSRPRTTRRSGPCSARSTSPAPSPGSDAGDARGRRHGRADRDLRRALRPPSRRPHPRRLTVRARATRRARAARPRRPARARARPRRTARAGRCR